MTHFTHTCFDGHFPGQPRLATWELPPRFSIAVYPYPEHRHRQAKILLIHVVHWASPCQLTRTVVQRGFEADVFTGQVCFLTPNQQHESTEVMFLLSGSLAAVKVILEIAGRECLEQRDANCRTPLILATMAGHGEVVNFLLAQGGQLADIS